MADLTSEIAKTSKAFEEGRKGLSKEFGALLDNVRETNASLGDSFLELRKQQKDSFVGALQTNKTRKLLADFNNGVLSSRGELRQILEKDLPRGFKSADEFFKTFDESNKALSIVSKDRLQSEETIAELNKEMVRAKAEGRAESVKTLKEEIDAEKALLDQKILTYDEIEKGNAELVDAIKESSEKAIKNASSGFEKFDSGLQELFGFGLGGMLDTLIAKTNAIGNLFGKDQLGNSIVDAIVQGFEGIGGGFLGGITEGATAAAVGSLAEESGGISALKDKTVAGIESALARPEDDRSLMDKFLGRERTGFEQGPQFRDAQTGQFLSEDFKLFNQGFTDYLKMPFEGISNVLDMGIDAGRRGVGALDRGISSGIEGAKGFAQSGLDAASNFGEQVSAKGLGPVLSDGLDSAMSGFGNTMKNTASTVNKGFGGMLRGISVGFTGLTSSLGGLVSGIGAATAGFATLVGGVLLAAAKFILIGALIFAVIYGLVKLAAYLDELSGGLIGEGIGEMFTAIGDFFGSIKDIFTGEQTVLQAAGNVVGSIGDYAMGAAKTIGGQILGAARAILPEWALKLLGWDDESMAIAQEDDREYKRVIGERESRRSDQQLENDAMESGLLAERNRWGDSKLDMTMLSTAPTAQLQALARLDDFDEETTTALRNELKKRADFADAGRLGLDPRTASSEEVARKRFELGEISEDEMNSQINNANNNQNVITNNNSTTIHGEQTTHPSDPMAAGGNMHLKPI